MRLLSKEEVKTDKQKEQESQAKRIRLLNEEAADSTRRINEARAAEKIELERMEDNIADAKKRHDEIISGLRGEVTSLEKRREDALKPTIEREKAVEKAEQNLALKEESINNAWLGVEEERNIARATQSEWRVKCQELELWEHDLKAREIKIVTDRQEIETFNQNSRELLKKEQTRLREYFEAEDAKLNLIKKQNG